MTAWPEGTDLLTLEQTDSTNAEARRRIGAPRPLWITAQNQTSGRGREGRPWASPPGNLAATLLLPSDRAPADLARHAFHAGLAVADLFDALAPGVPVAMKWPNDALLNGKKAAGVLLESFGPGGGHAANLAIGIGVNLAHHPDPGETRWPPTSVKAETGRDTDPADALTLLATALARWLAIEATQGFAPVRAAWLARAARLGQPIEARLPRESVTGRFEDLDSDGALVLRTQTGLRRIAAADVYFPG